MTERWTPEEFMAKVSWEGGFSALVEWGGYLTDEVPSDIEPEWRTFVDAYEALNSRREDLMNEDDGWEHQ